MGSPAQRICWSQFSRKKPIDKEREVIKKILIGLAVLVVIIGAGVFYLWSNMDGLIKTAIEKYGTQATQTQVKVDKVKLSPASGEGAISGVSIANPKGYSAANAFMLGTVSVKVDTGTITKSPIVIKEIVIDRPQVTYEMGPGGSNLQTIQANATKSGSSTSSSPAEKPAATSDKKSEIKLIIENLYVRNGDVAASHAALQGKRVDVKLPTIHLANIGKAKGGATPEEVASEVIAAISQQAAKAAAADLNKMLDPLKGQLGGQLGGASGTSGGGNVGDQLRGVLGR
jgi:hypothetical protein